MTGRPNRLIVVSNRVADDRPPAGGLVFALHDCLRQTGGLWVGSASQTCESHTDAVSRSKGPGYDRLLMQMSAAEHGDFYLGYANSVLWPLCHGRTDLMKIDANAYRGYRDVNARFARVIADEVRPGDLVWIHDYHFLPLAHELRKLGVSNRIGFFLHIPFPAGHDLLALSEGSEVMAWLAAHDIVGVQSGRDVAQVLAAGRQDPVCEVLMNGALKVGDRVARVRAFPIGIEADSFADAAQDQSDAPRLGLEADEPLVIGVDRLDYSKGLPNRFDGFARFLGAQAQHAPRATFLQIAPASRGEVPAYQAIRRELEQKAGAINGAYATLDWTPLRYISRHIGRETLARLYRRAQVGLVTPLIDGMNLVAKEFVAAQDPDDPGVLILSRLAGAAEQLQAAVLINPHDPGDIAAALAQALDMSRAERKARHADLSASVFGEDIGWWTRSFLDRLGDDPLTPEITQRLEALRQAG